MPRVKRGTKRRAKRKKILDRASGYFLTKSKLYRSAKESVERGAEVCLLRAQAAQAAVSLAVDRAHRRGRQAERDELQPVHSRPEGGGLELDRKILADLAVKDPAGFSSLATQAKGAIAGA